MPARGKPVEERAGTVAQRLPKHMGPGTTAEETNVRKMTLAVAAVSLLALGACKKTGEGEYEVEKPVMGTVTDTVETPSVDVKKDTMTVEVPKVEVKTPDERKKP